MFSPIRDLQQPPISFASGQGGGVAFGPEQVARRVEYVPVKDLRQIELAFPMPSFRHHVFAKPSRYWSHLIGHEGKGSILSYLKQKGISTCVDCINRCG
jgi:insulysin